jgi:hypothetical protein
MATATDIDRCVVTLDGEHGIATRVRRLRAAAAVTLVIDGGAAIEWYWIVAVGGPGLTR